MIQAGRLRHRVILQKPVQSQDSRTGAITETWQTVATLWAAIEPLSAREYIAAQAESSRVSTRIIVRYRDIDPDMRIYHEAKDTFYNIEGVLSDRDSGLEYITLPCSTGLRYIPGENYIPVILEPAVIMGSMNSGNIVTANPGLWGDNPEEYDYAWYINNVVVAGQTANTFTLPNNPGAAVKVGIIASNSAGSSAESFSAPRNITA